MEESGDGEEGDGDQVFDDQDCPKPKNIRKPGWSCLLLRFSKVQSSGATATDGTDLLSPTILRYVTDNGSPI